MKIITAINDTQNYYFNLLRLSCAVNRLQLVALVTDNHFYSRRIKDDLLLSYLEELPEEEIVVFTDGFDAVFLADETEILSKFIALGRELVFSAETGCWPDESLAEQYPAFSSPYKYLNSGGFIGRVGIIKALLEEDMELHNYEQSNQYIWVNRYFKYPDKIGLDTGCEIFCTFSPEVGYNYLPQPDTGNYTEYYRFMKDWFQLNFTTDRGRIFNVKTQSWPCQAHFNGHSKCLIDDDLVKLIYQQLPHCPEQVFLYATSG